MKLRTASPEDVPGLAMMHRAVFEAAWGEDEIATLLGAPGGFALIAESNGPAGFILCRAIGGEAEILTLAVARPARRLGFGLALVKEAALVAWREGADAIFLEVAEDNVAALALYETAGYDRAGRRPGYYRREGETTDALVMRRALNTAP